MSTLVHFAVPGKEKTDLTVETGTTIKALMASRGINMNEISDIIYDGSAIAELPNGVDTIITGEEKRVYGMIRADGGC